MRGVFLSFEGGEGSGKLLQQVRALAWGEHDWQVIAVCGRNEKLRRRLSRVRFSTPTAILGFVDFMPALMRAADLVVTKAGPGAIAEALATGVPMVLTGYLPGQETMNVRFVTQSGFGLYAPRSEELRQAVTRILAAGSGEVQDMAARAAAIARPYASLDIARECLAIAARYSVHRNAARAGAAGAAGAGSTEAAAAAPAANGAAPARLRWLRWAGRDGRRGSAEGDAGRPEPGLGLDALVPETPNPELTADAEVEDPGAKPARGRRSRPGGRRKGYRAASQGKR